MLAYRYIWGKNFWAVILMIIHKDSTINDIISAYPEAMKFFNDLNMACSSCFAVKFDTLQNGALMHGMEVNTLIEKLNRFIKSLPAPVSSSAQK